MKRAFVGATIVLAIAGVSLVLFRRPLTLRVVERVATRNMGSSLLDGLPDGLHVGLCGAGSPLPDEVRSGPCVFVIAGKQIYVVDAGSASSRVLTRLHVPQGDLQAVLLTHFHSDHIDGLGEIELQHWANGGHSEPLAVYGPEGVDEVVRGINLAYAASRRYRVAHHGEAIVPSSGAGAVARPFRIPAKGEAITVVDRDGLVIRAFRVDHLPVDPAVGYRFDYRGRSAVISGDTMKSTNLQTFARGADLLVHEAISPMLVGVLTKAAAAAGRENLVKITRDILDYHTTPVEAAEIARDADVGYLLFYHIVPPLPLAPMAEIFVEGVDAVYRGPVTVGRDGTFVHLDAGSNQVVVENLL